MAFRERERPPQWATDLAGRITDAWRGGPSMQTWEEELAELMPAAAETAFRRLRRAERSAPTVALFLDTYSEVGGTSVERADCNRCSNTGWVQVTDDRRHVQMCKAVTPLEREQCGCTLVEPCRCSGWGDLARRQQSRINRDRERRRAIAGIPPEPKKDWTELPPEHQAPFDEFADFTGDNRG